MPADQRLRLRLFGAPAITGAGPKPTASLLAKPKAFALLAYLAVARPRGFRRRDEILALLWPESSEERARNSLRQTLFMLRAHLPSGTIISRGRDEVGLAAIDVDVSTFEEQLDGGREPEALSLYGGALLEGFRLYANSDFDAWLTIERERLHRRAMRGAMVLAARGSRGGSPDGAAQSAAWARFAIERSPYDEELLREVLELWVRQGDRAGASELYRSAVARFRTELGISLSPETERAGRAAAGGQAPKALELADRTTPRANPAAVGLSSALLQPRAVPPEARRHYLEARQFAAQKSPVTILRAIDGYEQAIALSPDYAEAHSGLGFALCQAMVYVAYPASYAWPRAKAHASRAIRLDPRLGEGHAVLAHVTLCYDYDWDQAAMLYRKALELDPISPVSRQLYALYYLTAVGRTDDALAVLDRARDDFPDNPGISVYYGMISVMSRRFERGLREVEFVRTIKDLRYN